MSTPRSDAELPSESQSQEDTPKDDDKGKLPLVEELQVKDDDKGKLPLVEELQVKDDDRGKLPLVEELQVKDDDRGKLPLVDQPVPQGATSAPPNTESAHSKECRDCFKRILRRQSPHSNECWDCFQRILRRRADPEATTLLAGNLLFLLQNLGMASEVTADGLCHMLKLSGHADENGTLDFERFAVLAEDFKLLESIRAHKSTRKVQGGPDRGPLGDFFGVLEAAQETGGFMPFDFSDAFTTLDLTLTDENADSLTQYSKLHSGVHVPFEQFLKELDKEHMQRTGQMTLTPRANALDKHHCIGRLMAFAAAYIQPNRATESVTTTLPPIGE